jgi:hypothetical protein
MSYIYYVWVTALLSSYQDGIIAGMVKKGYMVGPASKDGQIISGQENSPAALIALSIYKSGETDCNAIYKDLVTLLVEMKAHYHSVIVALSTDAVWVGPNIQIQVKEKPKAPEAPPLPPEVKKNMN